MTPEITNHLCRRAALTVWLFWPRDGVDFSNYTDDFSQRLLLVYIYYLIKGSRTRVRMGNLLGKFRIGFVRYLLFDIWALRLLHCLFDVIKFKQISSGIIKYTNYLNKNFKLQLSKNAARISNSFVVLDLVCIWLVIIRLKFGVYKCAFFDA